ncbi:MAG: molybdenum cofactor biosysynthesis protein [Planctomycetes bacterium SCN 63-9]|nr:MAG: molybdenum cofactor biosysynthesis protein [Planctomycetes bacterium SCN 63-9]
MRVLSINVGLPKEVTWRGMITRTSIFKSPVSGKVRVSKLNLAGDQQSDLSVHGGIEKAVYTYSSEHYAYWKEELPDFEFPWGVFGENLTTEELLEESVSIGDRLRIGSAEFVVTQPRQPCFKLGIRFGRPDMVKRFYRSGRSGFYLAVLQEGEIESGDPVELIPGEAPSMTIAEVFNLFMADTADPAVLRRASELSGLSRGWRDDFRQRLEQMNANS